jgi:Ring finger domain
MESLKKFSYKIIFYKTPELIPENINYQEDDLCVICQDKVDPSLSEPIIILTCKHFFHRECIEGYQTVCPNLRCPLCRMESSKESSRGGRIDLQGIKLIKIVNI